MANDGRLGETISPGSLGERLLQTRYGTETRAGRFYSNQLLDHLTEQMCAFIARQTMCFIATADSRGECDCSFRAGSAGFVRVLDESHVTYPEYRGNGVMASLGNIVENGHVGILFVDFFEDTIGLHINGRAHIVDDAGEHEGNGSTPTRRSPRAERWVQVDVEEAYIHCSKHIPRLEHRPKSIDWGTDDEAKKGGDYFGARCEPRRR